MGIGESTRRTLWGLCMLAALCVATPSHALDPRRLITQYGHDAWTSDNGLPQNTVFALARTRDGYLWLGTWEGLVRFDGARFTVFDRRKTPELRGGAVLSLLEDAAGVLWVGTEKGLVAYERGRFRRFPAEGPLAEAPVRALLREGDALWLGTGMGLVRVPLSGEGPQRHYTVEDGLPTHSVLSLARDRAGVLWVGTPLGLARLDGDALKAYALPGPGPQQVNALHASTDGTLWVGTHVGLYALQDGKATRYTGSDGLPCESVTALGEDREGNLWVGLERGGLARRTRGVFSSFGPRDSLSDAHVLSLKEDGEGSLWVGTYSNGLVRMRDGVFATHGVPEGLSSDSAMAVLEDGTGALWVGTQGAGLNRLKDGRVERFGPAEGFTEDTVRSLALARDGTLWVGTYGGAFHFDGQRFTPFGRARGLPDDVVWSILGDSRGDMWFGTKRGLARLHEGRVTVFAEAQGVPAAPIVTAVEGADGVLWFGTYAGLLRYADGAFTRYTRKDGLVGDAVLTLYADPGGVLWIGTNAGLSRLKDGHFSRITTEQGLHDDAVFSVVPDGEGRLWMSSNRGVSRVSLSELNAVAEGQRAALRPTVFDTRDGMRSAECNGTRPPSGWRGRDGRLWFTTIRGVVAVDPREARPSPQAPDVRIEEVRVQGRPVELSAAGLELPPGSRDVEFRFTAFARGDTSRLPFRYRLEGHDEGWLDAEGRRAVSYSNLAPGTYRFRVTAASRDGVWAEPGAVLSLKLAPHFHETGGFYALSALAAGGLAAALYRVRVGRLRARERWLEEKVEERTRVLRDTQAQLVQAGRMAAVGTLAAGVGHEINNPLAYIVSNLEFASAELAALQRQARQLAPDAMGQRLKDAEQVLREALLGTDRVRRIVKDLKTFSRGDDEARGPVDLHAVLDAAAKMVAGELRPRGRLVKDYGRVPWVEGNEARLGQVFLNLLINAAQALSEGRPEAHEVRLVTKSVEGRVVAEVHDTGCGIPPEVLGRIYDPFFTTKPVGVGTGLGLALCHTFVSAMGGEIGVESQPGHTVFRVTLPASARAEAVTPVPVAAVAGGPVRGRVLVVDDDPLVGASMRRTLVREHEVEVLTGALEALARLREPEALSRYDVVLCDLMMPDLTGMELHAHLEAEAPAVAARMVFVTGGAFTPGAQAFLERVPNPRLEKPFEPDRLRELVRARVQQARAAAAGQAA